MGTHPGDVTRLLKQMSEGDEAAQAHLMTLVYDELRAMAGRYMRHERAGNTYQPTALVNEAYVRMVDQSSVHWKSRAHFFGVAAQVMRHILIDHARERLALKRGGGRRQVTLGDIAPEQGYPPEDLLAIHEALERLAAFDPRQSRIVELRFFGGLTEEETAEVMSISVRTIRREWSVARAWLRAELAGPSPG